MRRKILNIQRSVKPTIIGKSTKCAGNVVTTGSTMNECARVLKAAGVERVIGAAGARAV